MILSRILILFRILTSWFLFVFRILARILILFRILTRILLLFMILARILILLRILARILILLRILARMLFLFRILVRILILFRILQDPAGSYRILQNPTGSYIGFLPGIRSNQVMYPVTCNETIQIKTYLILSLNLASRFSSLFTRHLNLFFFR